jgi:tetratricopeptide (TPR) repeat protein
MNLDDYLCKLEHLHNMMLNSDETDAETILDSMITLLCEALDEFPLSSELWCIKGDYIFMKNNYKPKNNIFKERESCYKYSIILNESYSYAYESLGHLYHEYSNNSNNYYGQSEAFFKKGIEKNAGSSCYIGLAQLFADTNRKAMAIECLEEAKEKFGNNHSIQIAMSEILNGYWDE